MIEIIVVWRMAVNIGKIADNKGLKKFPYQLMSVLLWICGELSGAFLGRIFLGSNSSTLLYYGAGLLGAIAGSGIAFLVMRLAPSPGDFAAPNETGIPQEMPGVQKFKRSAWIPTCVILISIACVFLGFGGSVLFQVISSVQQIRVTEPVIGIKFDYSDRTLQPSSIIDSRTGVIYLSFNLVNPSEKELPVTFDVHIDGAHVYSYSENFTQGEVVTKLDRSKLSWPEFPVGNYVINIRTGLVPLGSTSFSVQSKTRLNGNTDTIENQEQYALSPMTRKENALGYMHTVRLSCSNVIGGWHKTEIYSLLHGICSPERFLKTHLLFRTHIT
jgi:hypothetical protein